jgi:hypothetical protein
MQPETITITRSDSSTVTYTRYQENPNSSAYVAGDSTISVPHTLGFKRTEPKPNGTFAGVARGELRVSKMVVDSAGNRSPAILLMDFSLPVATTSTDRDDLIEELKLLLADSVTTNLITRLEV